MSTSYIARSIFEDVRKEFPNYIIKFSSDNPRNPLNQAGKEELKIIEKFNKQPQLQKWEGQIVIDGKKYLAKFSARRMVASCSRCHGDPEDAPASLLKKYGNKAGFYRKLGDVLGLDTIAIPMANILEQRRSEFLKVSFFSGLGIVIFFVVTILITRYLIINRLSVISNHFIDVAQEKDHRQVQPIIMKGDDEISSLVVSFNIMSERLKESYTFLNDQVNKRTAELKKEITEHKQSEKKLRQSEEKFRSAFKTSPNVITLTSVEDGIYIDVNDAFTELLGYSQKETIGESSLALNIWNNSKDRDFLVSGLKKNGFVRNIEAEFKGKHGQIITGLMSANILDIENKKYLLAVTQDISDKKATDQAMRLMQYGVDRARDCIFWMNSEAHFIYVNDAACSLLGYSREELLFMDLSQIDSKVSLDTWPDGLAKLKKIKSNMFESQHQTKDGRLVPVEIASSYILFEGEEGIFSFVRDVTERKNAEERNEKLTDQLNQTQRMEAIGTLAGGIAHDFNNILSGILGYSQLAKMHISDPIKATKNIDQVVKGSRKATDLVKQILTFSRKSNHEMQPTRIFIEVKEAIKLLRSSIPSTIEIKDNIVSKATVLANLTQMHQVVMNLCTNAYHAMRKKGGILTVGLNQVEISTTNGTPDLNIKPGAYLKLEVSDTGYGMEPDTMDKIFEPYFTTKKIGEGTGLGLAVVLGIVEEHNGYIKAYSEPGKGSTFHVYFPIIKDQFNSNSLVELKNKLPGGTERIIIVDDEVTILTSMQELLEDYGYRVMAFSNSEHALTEFKKNPYQFDLIITDMTMPKMTGKDLSEQILKIRDDLPILLCTGYSENFSEDKALRLGITKYIQKPVDYQDLLAFIREVLDER